MRFALERMKQLLEPAGAVGLAGVLSGAVPVAGAQESLRYPVGVLGTVHTLPWQAHGRTALLGDAAHAIVPFYGQGMNCAFEDCVALAGCLRSHPDDCARALAEFEADRKENADALTDLPVDSFIEMRGKTALIMHNDASILHALGLIQ